MFNNIGSHGYAIIHSVQIYNVVYVNVYMYVYTIYKHQIILNTNKL